MGGRGRKVEKTTLDGAIEAAASIVGELRDELAEWRDNLSSANMEHLPKYEEVSEAADALEQASSELETVEVPDRLKEVEVEVEVSTRSRRSRSDRASDATTYLYAVVSALENESEEIEEDIEDSDEESEELRGRQEEVEELKSSIEDRIGEIEEVSFPGMY